MDFSTQVSRSLVATIIIATALSLTACIGGRSEPAQYRLLTARAERDVKAPLASATIGIGPVHVAQFLQRPQVVTHNGGATLSIETNQRWGEPLEQGIQRVLLQNIGALTGAETRNFPWRQSATPLYAVRIDVIDLDTLGNGDSILDVNWIVEDLKNARAIKTQQQRLTSREGYDELFAQLAQQIATALNSAQPTP